MKKIINHKVIFVICLVVSIGLIVGGFFVPPTGEIDGSVITAVGEIFAFATLAQVVSIIKGGQEVHLKHGDTELHIGDEEENNEN